ncbi:MAG: sigma-70 family RNA polymerase sigma factor [Gemmatimonadota bacterium]|nr:sigma-70 family RNA polymerase sigma factor [Gemmatimonadota bacterium]
MRIFEHYLDEIGRESLLSPERESELAALARDGDERARRRLATANLRFVVSVARRYRGHGLSLGDLVNEGNLGLLRAAERFDETRGVRFVSYAHWWVRRAIIEAIDRHVAHPVDAVPVAELSLDEPLDPDGDGTLQDILADPDADPPDAPLSREVLRTAVEASLADLPRREATVVRRYYGLESGYAENLREIGRGLGVSPERVRQLRDRGLARLRASASRHDLRAFGEARGTRIRAARRSGRTD